MPEQPSTAGRIDTMFDMQKLQLKDTLLIRFAGIRVRAGGAIVRLHTARFGGHAIYKFATHRHLRVRPFLVVDGMVGPRRVRIASGLRDPPRHVVVTALDRTGHHAANHDLSDDNMPRPSVPLD